MYRRNKSLLFLLLLFILPFTAYAQYEGTVAYIRALDGKIDSLTYHQDYDTTFTEPFRIKGYSTNTIPVYYVAIGFDWGDAGTYNPRSMYQDTINLDYQLYDSIASGNILKSFSTSTPIANMITIDLGGSGKTGGFAKGTSFEIEVSSGQAVANGLYKDQPITVELWGLIGINGIGPDPTIPPDLNDMVKLDSMTFKLHCQVDGTTRAAIIEDNGAFEFNYTTYRLNFNELTPNETMYADLIVESTASYSIDVESQRGNQLKNTAVDEYIAYTFNFEGSSYTLPDDTVVNLVTNAPASYSPGDRYDIDIVISSSIGSVLSGTYKDNLYFTITGN